MVQDLHVPDTSVHTRSPLPKNRHTSLSLFPGVEASKPPCLQKCQRLPFAIAQGVKNCVPPVSEGCCQYHKPRLRSTPQCWFPWPPNAFSTRKKTGRRLEAHSLTSIKRASTSTPCFIFLEEREVSDGDLCPHLDQLL